LRFWPTQHHPPLSRNGWYCRSDAYADDDDRDANSVAAWIAGDNRIAL
jgi:hypothetical protein